MSVELGVREFFEGCFWGKRSIDEEERRERRRAGSFESVLNEQLEARFFCAQSQQARVGRGVEMVGGRGTKKTRMQLVFISSNQFIKMSQPSLWGTAAAVGLASGLIGYVSLSLAPLEAIADSLSRFKFVGVGSTLPITVRLSL